MTAFLRRLLRPSTKQSIFRADDSGRSEVGRVLGGIVVCLAVTALLSSGRLVDMAEGLEFGPNRDRWVGLAGAVDRAAAALSLDRPARSIDTALGRSDADATIVLGELAQNPSPLTARTTTVPTTATTTPPTTTQPGGQNQEPTTTVEPTTTTATTPPTTAPSTTTTRVLGVANVNDPLRVWVGGDSLGEYVGSRLLYKVANPSVTAVELEFEISTGLARPDYFDWPGRLSEVMVREDRPQVVVFMAGGNDDQDMSRDGGRLVLLSEDWLTEYRQRTATMMDIAAYPDAQLIWVNLPPMKDGKRQEMASAVNQILSEEAALRSWVTVVDIVPMFTGPSGGFEQFLVRTGSERTTKARANDGVHITASASQWVAELVWTSINASWQFDESVSATTTVPQPTTSTSEPPATEDPLATTSTTS